MGMDLSKVMQGNPQGLSQPQDGQDVPMTGGHPLAAQMSPPQMNPDAVPNIDPKVLLEEVITQYMQYAMKIVEDNTLDKPIQSKILVEQAQALASLVPLLTNDAQTQQMQAQHDMQIKEQEFSLKEKEMQMNLQMKQAELEMKQQGHQQDMQFKQESNQQQLQQQQDNHQLSLVQSNESHKSQMEQQKQALQLKNSSNPVKGGGKNSKK